MVSAHSVWLTLRPSWPARPGSKIIRYDMKFLLDHLRDSFIRVRSLAHRGASGGDPQGGARLASRGCARNAGSGGSETARAEPRQKTPGGAPKGARPRSVLFELGCLTSLEGGILAEQTQRPKKWGLAYSAEQSQASIRSTKQRLAPRPRRGDGRPQIAALPCQIAVGSSRRTASMVMSSEGCAAPTKPLTASVTPFDDLGARAAGRGAQQGFQPLLGKHRLSRSFASVTPSVNR